jgi:shikimate kinase
MKSNVALIGFMGTGKTAVGQALARRLGWKLVEVDSLIEKLAGKSIPQIFSKDGEIAFRELEIEAVKQAAGRRKQVIACGGGVVLNTINIERLRQTSVIVLLTASPAAILRRTSGNPGARPLLDVPDPVGRIRELLKFRRPFYTRAADITVSTSSLTIGRATDLITKKLRDYEGFDLPKQA